VTLGPFIHTDELALPASIGVTFLATCCYLLYFVLLCSLQINLSWVETLATILSWVNHAACAVAPSCWKTKLPRSSVLQSATRHGSKLSS